MRLILLSLLALSGCAPHIVAANSAGGMVNSSLSLGHARAFEMANAHCEKFGKVARMSGRDELRNTMAFDCVTP